MYQEKNFVVSAQTFSWTKNMNWLDFSGQGSKVRGPLTSQTMPLADMIAGHLI